MNDIGWVAVGSTINFMFTTHAASGAGVAPSTAFESADLDVYKDNSATPRSVTNGITMTSPFASTTGLHLVTMDLSDNTDAGFYAAGSTYHAVLTPDETVDSLAVVKVVVRFTIGVQPANTTQWLGTAAATPTVGGVPEVDVTHIAGSTTDVSTIAASIAAILVDTGTTLDGKLPALLVGGKMDASVGAIVAAALAQFFTVDSGTTFASAVAGSVVAETADNAVGGAAGDSDPFVDVIP